MDGNREYQHQGSQLNQQGKNETLCRAQSRWGKINLRRDNDDQDTYQQESTHQSLHRPEPDVV